MANVLVHLESGQEWIIAELTKAGFFKTKSETIRAAINGLGKEYDILGKMRIKQITDPKAIAKMQKISEEIKNGTRKVLSAEEVRKMYPNLPLP